MGLLTGILSRERKQDLKAKLESMMACQIHRDRSEPVKILLDGIALGMANKHDVIYCKNRGAYNLNKDSRHGNSEIKVLVDGIVIEKTKDKNSATCSSVISSAYTRWGDEFMNHLEGEFSCAVWDNEQKRLLLARDPYGHKPLHYFYDGQAFVFASEIKGIINAGIRPEIDLVSLSDFLSLNNFPYPLTAFKGILQVPPGTVVIFEGRDIKVKPYWYPRAELGETLSYDQIVHDLSEDIRSAVRKRMVTDDTYCFLSGGVDSGLTVSFASELAGKPIHAISVGFSESERNELDEAALMAQHVGAHHHPVVATQDSFFSMLDIIVSHYDIPFTDTSSYPTFYAAKCASTFTDVILTGDGPDQIFGGSDHYRFALANNIFQERNRNVQRISGMGSFLINSICPNPAPSLFTRMARKLHRQSLSPVKAAYELRSYFPIIAKEFLCSDDLWEIHLENDPYRHPENWFREEESQDDINKYLLADMKFYLPDDLMVKVDRMCMAHGLETLSPFLDLSISRMACKMPGSYKIFESNETGIVGKRIIRDICRDRFPAGLLNKRKQGFGIPLEKWLKKDGGKYIKEVLLDPGFLNRGYFKKKSIEHLVDVFLAGKGDYFYPSANGIVGLLTLELCHRRYIG